MFWPILGTIAAVLTMFSFIPQIIKAIKTKSAKDISSVTLVQLAAGVTLWIIYGIHLKNFIIIMANSVTLLSLIILFGLYLYYKREDVEKFS